MITRPTVTRSLDVLHRVDRRESRAKVAPPTRTPKRLIHIDSSDAVVVPRVSARASFDFDKLPIAPSVRLLLALLSDELKRVMVLSVPDQPIEREAAMFELDRVSVCMESCKRAWADVVRVCEERPAVRDHIRVACVVFLVNWLGLLSHVIAITESQLENTDYTPVLSSTTSSLLVDTLHGHSHIGAHPSSEFIECTDPTVGEAALSKSRAMFADVLASGELWSQPIDMCGVVARAGSKRSTCSGVILQAVTVLRTIFHPPSIHPSNRT